MLLVHLSYVLFFYNLHQMYNVFLNMIPLEHHLMFAFQFLLHLVLIFLLLLMFLQYNHSNISFLVVILCLSLFRLIHQQHLPLHQNLLWQIQIYLSPNLYLMYLMLIVLNHKNMHVLFYLIHVLVFEHKYHDILILISLL